MNGQDYRDTSLASWEASAPGWARWSAAFNATARPVSDWMLERLDPRPGQTVLELAAGTGDLGYEVARHLGADGRLISSDFSPEMLEWARRRANELGIGNAEFRVVDAERIDLPDASVDGVICRYGYMLVADPGAALRESRRVLRSGGRAVFATWAEPERNPWGAIVGRVLVDRGAIPPPEPGQPGIFALSDPDRIRALVTAAGFDEPTIEEMPVTFEYDSFDDYWDFVQTAAGAVANVLAALPRRERNAIRDAVAEGLAPFGDDAGRQRYPGVSLNVLACRERPDRVRDSRAGKGM